MKDIKKQVLRTTPDSQLIPETQVAHSTSTLLHNVGLHPPMLSGQLAGMSWESGVRKYFFFLGAEVKSLKELFYLTFRIRFFLRAGTRSGLTAPKNFSRRSIVKASSLFFMIWLKRVGSIPSFLDKVFCSTPLALTKSATCPAISSLNSSTRFSLVIIPFTYPHLLRLIR